jgi:putative ABC transport system permease protein
VIVLATLGPLVFALGLVVRADPWYDPQLLVPLAGMVMGNAMSSLVLGLDRFYGGLKDQWRIVEARLSLGATRYQACLPVTRGAARAALLPLINTMMIIGVVHLPGMIVGQITAGGDPAQASRYQLMIMYVIGATNSLSTLGVIYLGIQRFTTASHQLRYLLLEDASPKRNVEAHVASQNSRKRCGNTNRVAGQGVLTKNRAKTRS